jgi:hypothetical protein
VEILKINNFLCIENAEIEIKRINLFIGEQAQGKSVIAKLIYFFKEYPHTLIESVYRGMTTKEGSDTIALAKFEKIFPAYTWSNTEFSIKYSNKYYSIVISCKDGKLDLNSDWVIREVFTTLNEARRLNPYMMDYKFNVNELPYIYDGQDKRVYGIITESFSFLDAVLIDYLFKNNTNPFLEKNIYIPAGRSFFATLGNNLYSFINSEIKIDYFLVLFGKTYQNIRTEKHYYYTENKKNYLESIVEKIIGGQFLFENGQDWIVNQRGKISLSDASSGQQESLPITTVLLKSPYFHHSHISNHFVIEEPEAHLFPQAQSYISQLISNAYNEGIGSSGINGRFNSFTIATHSPYILTAFNNLIQAGNVAQSKNYQNLEELYKVVPKDEIVNFDDVSAYFVSNGTVKSILDEELKLIDASFIDSVSRNFANIFEKLVIMEENND